MFLERGRSKHLQHSQEGRRTTRPTRHRVSRFLPTAPLLELLKTAIANSKLVGRAGYTARLPEPRCSVSVLVIRRHFVHLRLVCRSDLANSKYTACAVRRQFAGFQRARNFCLTNLGFVGCKLLKFPALVVRHVSICFSSLGVWTYARSVLQHRHRHPERRFAQPRTNNRG